MTRINSINVLDDDAMENVTGGTERQTRELLILMEDISITLKEKAHLNSQ